MKDKGFMKIIVSTRYLLPGFIIECILNPKPPYREAPVPRAVLSKENAIIIIRFLLKRA
jgi:hypothetical protein